MSELKEDLKQYLILNETRLMTMDLIERAKEVAHLVSKDDIDTDFYSLKKYVELLLEGQPIQEKI